MDDVEEFEKELTTYIHDLFLDTEFLEWRKGLEQYSEGQWHSLIVKLSNADAPIDRLRDFGEQTYSKLVFNYVKAPDYKESKMLMVQFTVSGSLWHSLVWHCPNHN
ncbi:hypothetical protein L2750_04700 [Shewanella submarina]|uniref:Uncharacterized protein n=1 Tax=Shewanella submarina TaxID=2016376 RepID=A0ABV7GGV2_9GAMM|nr:hypothetical protein [Shewanella submarina]MCL1036450.1 hypothetical protein [Shewanella submarina]